MFMLTPSASSTDHLRQPAHNVYQICFTDPALGSAVSAPVIAEHGLIRKFAVIWRNNAVPLSPDLPDHLMGQAAMPGASSLVWLAEAVGPTDFSRALTEAA